MPDILFPRSFHGRFGHVGRRCEMINHRCFTMIHCRWKLIAGLKMCKIGQVLRNITRVLQVCWFWPWSWENWGNGQSSFAFFIGSLHCFASLGRLRSGLMAFLKEAAEPLLRCYPWSGLAPSCPCFIGFSAARFTYTKSISSNTLLGSEGARQNVVFQCSIFFYGTRMDHCCMLRQNFRHSCLKFCLVSRRWMTADILQLQVVWSSRCGS